MAYAALDSLRQTIEEITLSPDYSMSVYNIDKVRSIDELTVVLQEFADKFTEEAGSLEGRIVDAANEAQDVLEHFISKLQSPSRFGLAKFTSFLAKFRRMAKIHRQLEKIRGAFDAIAAELKEMEKNLQTNDSPAANKSSAIAVIGKIGNVVGLDDDLLAIKTRLCGESPNLQVIPIVGMGGIGKTTLSRKVYNDPLTIQYFDVRAWITVSQDYSAEKVVLSLMDSVKEFVIKKPEQSDEETVYKTLKGRRYLIVMDDIWSGKAWDDVRDLFPNDRNGSRIMLTTRLSDVAAYAANSSPLHEMRFMNIKQSWELLRQRVFSHRDCSPELENIGREIAESCRGLPLAISVIAGLLSTVERSSTSWQEIADNVSSIVVKEDGRIDEILSLSYAHLPQHLRACFLFMGGFPEDHEIRVSQLIRLWVAEGFSSCSKGSSKSLEDEAEECLGDLVGRSLVLVTKRKSNSRIKSCSLHDLVRDLCIRKAKEKKFFVNVMDGNIEKEHFIDRIKDQHRISVETSILRYLSSGYYPTIRTIMCFKEMYEQRNMDFVESVGLLRVLDAEKVIVASLSDSLFELLHLRYLAITPGHGCKIPTAILKLHNLQTLIIKQIFDSGVILGRSYVDCLPQEIWLLPQLRHLICYGRFPYPMESTSLKNLQTLSSVLHDMCVEEILEKIPNIKKLGIDCSYYGYGTHLNNLVYLHQLESLKLRNMDWRKDSISFPMMLRNLTLRHMSLIWSEMSILGSLPNLEVLKLRVFSSIGSSIWETSQGEFPQLQYLLIEGSDLQHWMTEQDHFPRLKVLLIHDCWYLDEIPEGIGEIATLELIDVRGNSLTSLVDSARRIQEEQESLGNDVLQVYYPLPK